MARRRLLTLLAASSLLVGALAGPAAAADLVTPIESGPSVVAETLVEDAVDATADLAETTAAPVEDTVDATPAAEALPTAAPRSAAPAPSAPAERSEPTTTGPEDEAVVAAGGVTSAPPIDLLVSLGGSERTVAPGTPLDAPAMAPSTATTDEVEAPMVAPAPATPAAAGAPSALAQAVDGLPEEGAPALALVALAALLAAGAATVQTARAEAMA